MCIKKNRITRGIFHGIPVIRRHCLPSIYTSIFKNIAPLYEVKVDTFTRTYGARTCSDCLSHCLTALFCERAITVQITAKRIVRDKLIFQAVYFERRLEVLTLQLIRLRAGSEWKNSGAQ